MNKQIVKDSLGIEDIIERINAHAYKCENSRIECDCDYVFCEKCKVYDADYEECQAELSAIKLMKEKGYIKEMEHNALNSLYDKAELIERLEKKRILEFTNIPLPIEARVLNTAIDTIIKELEQMT